MNRKQLTFICLTLLISLLTGCLQLRDIEIPKFKKVETPPPLSSARELQMGGYVPKIDSFIIILDSSSSMSANYRGDFVGSYSKFIVAKDIINRMNKTMPDMDIIGALQRFGFGFMEKGEPTETVYGPTMYSRSELEQALNSIKTPGGHSPAGLAIGATSDIVGATQGETAVIVISDGEKLKNDPLMKVQVLKDRYGERTCLYTVWVGNQTEGKEFMEKLASEMECGSLSTVDDVLTDEGMADFVRNVFLARDSDGDGVPDDADACPGTPPGVQVDASGCSKDRDGDGVADDSDACPNTPRGAIVDNRGCWVVKGVKFDYKKWDVKPQFNTNLNNIINILKRNPGLKIRIEGHTDNIGSKKYNLELSGKRAKAIKAYLVKNGVGQSRITTIGHGFSKPIAGNDTKKGRALNRRAELIPIK
ncbi:MAG: OmpA family protein [Deltaproteobacteria bacterium]|nr:OmpA family protein [Candidatus Brocadiaceae bacterium]MCP4369312.1 OmpA family protein [Deltaproteobacteria bacterium]